MNVTGGRPAEVLLVEDNEVDVLLTRKAFERAKLAVNLRHLDNGERCMKLLRREGEYVDAPAPDLILLDLNMPVMDGREVLSEIVKDEELRKMPVVILTTSQAEADLLEMYSLRCSSYIIKPIDFDKFQRVIQDLCNYWFTVVVLPPNR